MNHAKIAAALHALAEAFEGAVEEVKDVATGKGKKAKLAEQPVAPAAAALAQAAAATAAATPAPAVPSITKEQLNKAVLKVAAKSRDTAEAILNKFGAGAKNTVTLAPEYWQPVFDALEEEIAKQDAAAVQVAQASLV
jgi:hypothetical protein